MIVEWSIPSQNDLDDIWLFIAQDNPDRAQEYINKLVRLGNSLEDDITCEKGKKASWTVNSNIRELYFERYTIVYEILGYRVIIHEVYNQSKIHLHFANR